MCARIASGFLGRPRIESHPEFKSVFHNKTSCTALRCNFLDKSSPMARQNRRSPEMHAHCLNRICDFHLQRIFYVQRGVRRHWSSKVYIGNFLCNIWMLWDVLTVLAKSRFEVKILETPCLPTLFLIRGASTSIVQRALQINCPVKWHRQSWNALSIRWTSRNPEVMSRVILLLSEAWRLTTERIALGSCASCDAFPVLDLCHSGRCFRDSIQSSEDQGERIWCRCS